MSVCSQSNRARYRHLNQAVLFTVALVWSGIICTAPTFGQDGQGATSSSPTPLERISKFHEKMKNRFGIKRKTEPTIPQTKSPSAADSAPAPRVLRTQYEEPILEQPQFHQGQPIGGANPNYYREPDRPSAQQYELPNQNQYTPVFVPPFPAPYQPIQGVPPNGYRDMQMSQPYNSAPPTRDFTTRVEQPAGNYQRQQYRPQRQPSQMPTARQAGHYQNGPGLTGQELQRTQITATQRALQLESENQLLKSAKESLTAENTRLRTLLNENRSLLARIEAAIEKARNELSKARRHNEKLKQKIAELEFERRKQAQQTAQLLNSIRRNLDDVIMGEMTNK